MINIGFHPGKSAPCIFYNAERGLRAYVYGDDFVILGMPNQLNWCRKRLEEKYEVTVEVLGPDAEQCREVRVLNRILRWTDDGIEYEADPRHVEIMLK